MTRRASSSRRAALECYRIYTGIHPVDDGRGGEHWIVKCTKCGFTDGPIRDMQRAKAVARTHDSYHATHDKG